MCRDAWRCCIRRLKAAWGAATFHASFSLGNRKSLKVALRISIMATSKRNNPVLTFKILIKGYVRKIGRNGIAASPTTLLIRSGGLNIIADPGTNKRLLLSSLKKEGIGPADVGIVFVSHYHLDHTINIALFQNAKVVDGTTVYDGDREMPHKGVIPGTKIKIIATPGHAQEHAALLIPTRLGRVVFASDVFWWKSWEKQRLDLEKEDEYATNMRALKRSRRELLNAADYIIPGHGKMFKVPR